MLPLRDRRRSARWLRCSSAAMRSAAASPRDGWNLERVEVEEQLITFRHAAGESQLHGPNTVEAHSTLAVLPGCRFSQTNRPFWPRELTTGLCPNADMAARVKPTAARATSVSCIIFFIRISFWFLVFVWLLGKVGATVAKRFRQSGVAVERVSPRFFVWPAAVGSGNSRSQITLLALRV